MRLENLKQEFPAMPEDIRAMVEKEVQKQVNASTRQECRPVRKLGRTLLIAAAVVVVLVMTAFGAYQYGVKDILTEKGISLTGDKNSSEYQANQEWNAYVDEYMETFDWDEMEEPEGYGNYLTYDWEMASVLESIAEKYELVLQTTGSIVFDSEEEAYKLLGTEDFLLLEHDNVTGYACKDGTFKMENAVVLKGESVNYSIFASAKSILNEIQGRADLGRYEEWIYETESGAVVDLVLGGNNCLILLETEDSYITVQIDSGAMNIAPGSAEEYEETVESIAAIGTPAQTEEEMYAAFQQVWSTGRISFTREMLEDFANGIDFEAISKASGYSDEVYEEYQAALAESRTSAEESIEVQMWDHADPETVFDRLGRYELKELPDGIELISEEKHPSSVTCHYGVPDSRDCHIYFTYAAITDETSIRDEVTVSNVEAYAFTTVNGHEALISNSMESPVITVSWLEEEKGLRFWIATPMFENGEDVVALAETVTLAE